MQTCKSIILLFTLIIGIALPQGFSNPVKKIPHGIVVYPDLRFSGNTAAVRLLVVANDIIRVTASPSTGFADRESLIVLTQEYSENFTVSENDSVVTVATPLIVAKVLLTTGAVSFYDNNGRMLLWERSHHGRNFTPAVFEAQKSFGFKQTFETNEDDAYYGLGQHQSDQFNYKGEQIFLFQNNTEVAIPFLVSKNNYGILWDNYSLTTVGDTREYLPLSSLKLFDKEGRQGWLTASYRNENGQSDHVDFIKAESEINYPFLGDTKKGLPEKFTPANGSVRWEGSFTSGFNGDHKMLFSYGGYLKVWINEKLMLDRWRQSWNPGSGLLHLVLTKDQKVNVKIEWRPDGGESYITAKWLPPIPEKDHNTISFDSEAGQEMDYYFVTGSNMDSVIAGYRQLTGKATIVPKWAMGFWQSRERYKTQEEILNTAEEFRKRKIPIDNIVLDWSYWKQDEWGSQEFDSARFPAPSKMIEQLHNKYNLHFMISVWPKFYEGITAYKGFNKNGWLYPRNVADSQRDWIAQGYVSTFYDAFNRDARKGFWDLLNKKIYSKGVDAWWMDASEPDILSNVSPQKRKDLMTPLATGLAAEYLNAYPLENAKGIYNGQRSVDPNKRVFLLTRSGFAGSQHYAASIWSGDIGSRWEDMKAQISAGVNYSMSGLPFWTMDIGGFAVERRYEKPNAADLEEWRELQTRWYQFGAFVPLFRAHGQFPYREIYNISNPGDPAFESMLFYDKLRYRLLPYAYTLAGMTYHKHYTIMRGLLMDFINDTAVTNIGDQFMFGPSLLINPVYTFKAKSRKVYLPTGQGWFDLYSGKYMEGGQYITADAPYERMPVYVKEGSIIPFGPEIQYTDEKKPDPVLLFVYAGRDASFTLYEDEGINYNYEKGKFSEIPITYSESKKELTIGNRRGSFDGMLKNRLFQIVMISQGKPGPLDFDIRAGKEVKYSGKEVTVRL